MEGVQHAPCFGDRCSLAAKGGSKIKDLRVARWIGLMVFSSFFVMGTFSVAAVPPDRLKELEAYLEQGRSALSLEELDKAKELMSQARVTLDELSSEFNDDDGLARLRAQILVVQGSALISRDEEDVAEADKAQARAFFLEACTLFEGLRQKQKDNLELTLESAECHQYAAALHEALDDSERREEFMGRAMTMLREGLKNQPKKSEVRRRLAGLIVADFDANNYNMGEVAERKAVIQEAVDLLEGLVRESPDDLELKGELGYALPWLAFAGDGSDDMKLARAAHLRNIEIWNQLAANLPDNREVMVRQAGAHSGLAGLERDEGNFDRSIKLHLEAHSIRAELAARNPEDVDLQYSMVSDLHVIGVVAMLADDAKQTRQYFHEALAGYEKLAAAYPGATDAEEHLVLVQRLLGDVESGDDKWPEAQAAYREAMRRAEEFTDPSSAYGLREVAELWMHAAGRARVHDDPAFLKEAHPRILELAEKYFDVAKDRERAYGLMIQAHLDTADFAAQQKQSADEKRLLERALQLWEEAQAKAVEIDDEELEGQVQAGREKLRTLRALK